MSPVGDHPAGNGNTRPEGQRCSGGEPLTPAPPRAALAFTFTVRRRLVRAATFAVSVPRYLTLDPSRSLVPQPAEFPLHYPLLVAHVVFGSVAMLTCGFQVWPSFRRHHPEAHRRMGRIYVFGGVLPAGILGLVIGVVSPFGPVIRVSNVLLALLWLSFTIIGFRRARQRRFVEHRRWMIRSFALTMSIITNRVWAVIATLALMPQLSTTFGGSEVMMRHTISLAGWLGWVLTLLIAEWWLERDVVRSPLPNAPLSRPERLA